MVNIAGLEREQQDALISQRNNTSKYWRRSFCYHRDQ